MEKPDIENYKLGKGIRTRDYVSDLNLCIDQLLDKLKEVEKLNGAFPNGLGNYEWKIIENFNSKNFRITELESEKKALIKDLEQTISNLEGKQKSFLGTNGEMARANFKLGLGWAIEAFRTVLNTQ